METLSVKEKRKIFLDNIQSKVNTLQNLYDESDCEEWKILNKIQDLLDDLEAEQEG